MAENASGHADVAKAIIKEMEARRAEHDALSARYERIRSGSIVSMKVADRGAGCSGDDQLCDAVAALSDIRRDMDAAWVEYRELRDVVWSSAQRLDPLYFRVLFAKHFQRMGWDDVRSVVLKDDGATYSRRGLFCVYEAALAALYGRLPLPVRAEFEKNACIAPEKR